MRKIIFLFAAMLIAVVVPVYAQVEEEFEWFLYDAPDDNIPDNVTFEDVTLCDINFYSGNNRGIGPTAWMNNMSCGSVVWVTPSTLGHFIIDMGGPVNVISLELGWRWCCGSGVDAYVNGQVIATDYAAPQANYSSPDLLYETPFTVEDGIIDIAWDKMYLDYVHIVTGEASASPLTRPLQPIDRSIAFQSIGYEIGETDPSILANLGVFYGGKPNVLVSAVAAGTVTDIEPIETAVIPNDIDSTTCVDWFTPEVGGGASGLPLQSDCSITIVGDPSGESAGSHVPLFSLGRPPSPLFVVHIDGDDGREYLQLVTDYENYVFEGQHVEPGCYLGRVANIPTVSTLYRLSLIADTFIDLPIGLSSLVHLFEMDEDKPLEAITAAWVKEGGSFVDAWDEYTLDPSDSAPCNSPEGYEGCMGDSRLEDASQWQSSNGVGWLQPGALMGQGAFIRGTFNLDADRDPVVIVGAVANGPNTMSLSFGTAKTPTVFVLGRTSFELEAGDPDAGEFYTVELKNTGDVPTRIDFICVLHQMDRSGNPQGPNEVPDGELPPDVIQAPGTRICYFQDSSFEGGLEEWDQTGDVEIDDGVLLLPDDATISQDVKLKPGTYTLKVIVRLWTTGAYSPDDDDDSNGIEIEYAYPADTFVTVGGMQAWNKFAIKSVATLSATVTITEETDGTFTFRANVVSPPTGVLGAQLMSVCLTKEGDIDAGDGDGLIKPTCGSIPTPTLSATAPGTWFTWLWAQSNKFFRCELIRVINQIYGSMIQFFRTILWAFRWTQASMLKTATWSTTLFQWLNGHFANIALGQTTTVITDSGGCGNIFCLLETLVKGINEVMNTVAAGFYDVLSQVLDIIQDLIGYLLNPDSPFWTIVKDIVRTILDVIRQVFNLLEWLIRQAVTLLITIVYAVIAIIISVLTQILAVASLGRDLFNAIISAYNNATPIPVPGMPNCNVDVLSAWCQGIWVIDNTLYAPTQHFTTSSPGDFIQTIVIGTGSILLMIWAIKEIKKAIMNVGATV